ncbi:hypothetical protein ACXJY6_03555 [Vibrio sp. RC27]
MKLNNCCNTNTLKLVRRIYKSNADKFDVKQCPDCHIYWLYRYREENWWNNLQLKENEHEEWYVPLTECELEKVYKMDLSNIGYRSGFTHIRTTVPLASSAEWKRLKTPVEKPS